MRHSLQNKNHFDHLFINIFQLVNAIGSTDDKSSLTEKQAEQILELRQLLCDWDESHSRTGPDSQLPFEMNTDNDEEMGKSIQLDKDLCDAWDNRPDRLDDPEILDVFNATKFELNRLITDITGLLNKGDVTRTNRSLSQGSTDGTTDSELSENSRGSSPRHDGKANKDQSMMDPSSSQHNDPQLLKFPNNFYFDNCRNQYWISHSIWQPVDTLSEELKKHSDPNKSEQNNNAQLDEKRDGSSKFRQFKTLQELDEASDTDDENNGLEYF